MGKKLSALLGGMALLLIIGAGCAQSPAAPANTVVDTTPIKIGWIGPLTGDVASVGTLDRAATEFAVKEINTAGGINGRPLQVIYEDGKCDSKTASDIGNKLINVDKVVAIVGGFCSGETLAIAPMAEQNHVVMLSPASTAPGVSQAGDYVFRVVPSDNYQGKYAANFVFNTMGKKKVAVLYANNDYGTGLANVFSDEFKKLGGEVVVTEPFLQTARDLRTPLTKIKNSNAEVIYFPTYSEAGVVGFKQIKELGLTIPVVGPETLSDLKLVTADGADGTMFTKPISKDDPDFKTKILAALNQTEIPTYAGQSYDATYILANALKSAGANGEAIKNALYQVKNYSGVSGNISFDSNGDLEGSAYEVLVIKNGQTEKYR